jgi:nicotinamide mononucleotide (NMN) deamidase PncC
VDCENRSELTSSAVHWQRALAAMIHGTVDVVAVAIVVAAVAVVGVDGVTDVDAAGVVNFANELQRSDESFSSLTSNEFVMAA